MTRFVLYKYNKNKDNGRSRPSIQGHFPQAGILGERGRGVTEVRLAQLLGHFGEKLVEPQLEVQGREMLASRQGTAPRNHGKQKARLAGELRVKDLQPSRPLEPLQARDTFFVPVHSHAQVGGLQTRTKVARGAQQGIQGFEEDLVGQEAVALAKAMISNL